MCQMVVLWLMPNIKKMVSKLLIKLHKREDAPCISLRRLTFSFSPLRRALISSSSCCWSINEKTTGVTQAKAHTIFMTFPVHCRFVQVMCVVLLPLWIISVVFSLGNLMNILPKQTFTFSKKDSCFIFKKSTPFNHTYPYSHTLYLKGNSPVSDISFFIALSASLFLFLLESRSTI